MLRDGWPRDAFICVIGVAALIGFAVLWDSNLPNSTAGVSVVSDEARLPRGETLIATHVSGEGTHVWEITYDGDKTVNFHCTGLMCSDFTGTLASEVGQQTVADAGWLNGDFHLSRQADGTVGVKRPLDWTYRPYRD